MKLTVLPDDPRTSPAEARARATKQRNWTQRVRHCEQVYTTQEASRTDPKLAVYWLEIDRLRGSR